MGQRPANVTDGEPTPAPQADSRNADQLAAIAVLDAAVGRTEVPKIIWADPDNPPDHIRDPERWAWAHAETVRRRDELFERDDHFRRWAERTNTEPGGPVDQFGVARTIEVGSYATAEWCAFCAHPIEPGEAVVRERRGRGRFAPVCWDCNGDYAKRWWFSHNPCPTCGREVWHNAGYATEVACCENHLQEARATRRKAKRAEARVGLRCEWCGEPLDSDRSDARYCTTYSKNGKLTSSCRQAAYRARKRAEA
jgi:hypothetical protein